MAITKYDPFEFPEFSTPMRLFQDAVTRLFGEPVTTRPWAPPVDIMETENEVVLKADLPDVDLKDVDIQIEQGTLTLRGERKFEKSEKGQGYHRLERSYGQFVRCFALPETVDTDQVKADYRKGVLTVSLPKKEVAKPKRVKVQVSDE